MYMWVAPSTIKKRECCQDAGLSLAQLCNNVSKQSFLTNALLEAASNSHKGGHVHSRSLNAVYCLYIPWWSASFVAQAFYNLKFSSIRSTRLQASVSDDWHHQLLLQDLHTAPSIPGSAAIVLVRVTQLNAIRSLRWRMI